MEMGWLVIIFALKIPDSTFVNIKIARCELVRFRLFESIEKSRPRQTEKLFWISNSSHTLHTTFHS